MATLKEMERRLEAIERRNSRVELDKRWEMSMERRGAIVAFIYAAIVVYFFAVGIPNPWLNAIVPAVAFVLSTLTLAYLKKIWLKGRKI